MQDVEHAAHKVRKAGLESLIFVTGPRGRLVEGDLNQAFAKARKQGVDLAFFNISDLLPMMLWGTADVSVGKFVELLFHHGKKARVKDEVLQQIKASAE